MKYSLEQFRGDLFGGVTAAVVLLPMSFAFGVASGMGAAAGIYSAVAVGFFAAVFGGTRLMISGPTPPMAVAMVVILQSHASTLAEALTIVALAGLLQILLGALRAGRFVVYTPYVVISGFMCGIGFLIILIQAAPFFGSPPGAEEGIAGAIRELVEAARHIEWAAFAIGAVTLAAGFLWPRRLARVVPGHLVALVCGTLLGVLWLNDTPVIGPVPSGLPAFGFDPPSAGFVARAIQPSLILALIGSLETLLHALVADSMTGAQHRPNKELTGQGIGNIASGLFGGIPGGGNVLATVVNIRSGAATRVAGALCALFLLGVLLGLGRYLESVPHAVLAGMLVKVGWDIIDWRLLARIRHLRREHLMVMGLTLVLTLTVDLMVAVAIGLIAGGMVHARQLERLELDSVLSVPLLDRAFFAEGEAPAEMRRYEARVGLVALRGSFTVASSHRMVRVIGRDIVEHEVVIFDFTNATYLDDSAAMLIGRLLKAAAAAETEVVAMGLSREVGKTLRALGILDSLPDDQIVETLDEAREMAGRLLED